MNGDGVRVCVCMYVCAWGERTGAGAGAISRPCCAAGASSDMEQATTLARAMVTRYALSDKVCATAGRLTARAFECA